MIADFSHFIVRLASAERIVNLLDVIFNVAPELIDCIFECLKMQGDLSDVLVRCRDMSMRLASEQDIPFSFYCDLPDVLSCTLSDVAAIQMMFQKYNIDLLFYFLRYELRQLRDAIVDMHYKLNDYESTAAYCIFPIEI